jgi:hypothetical protein
MAEAGRTIQAIRTLVQTAAKVAGQNAHFEVFDPEGNNKRPTTETAIVTIIVDHQEVHRGEDECCCSGNYLCWY